MKREWKNEEDERKNEWKKSMNEITKLLNEIITNNKEKKEKKRKEKKKKILLEAYLVFVCIVMQIHFLWNKDAVSHLWDASAFSGRRQEDVRSNPVRLSVYMAAFRISRVSLFPAAFWCSRHRTANVRKSMRTEWRQHSTCPRRVRRNVRRARPPERRNAVSCSQMGRRRDTSACGMDAGMSRWGNERKDIMVNMIVMQQQIINNIPQTNIFNNKNIY